MDARVGARLEVVRPRRILFGADYPYLFVLVAVSVAVHTWVVSRTAVTARDSLGFARYALNLERPTPLTTEDGRPRTFVDELREAEHPPGYPAMVWVTSLGVRAWQPGELPDRMLLSAQLAAAVAGVLLVFPVYALGRGLFGSKLAGFAAALLFQVAPTVAQTTSDGLSEGPYLLLTAAALLCGVRAVRRRSTAWFLLCGLASGLAYVVRPEGLMVVPAVAAVTAGLGVLRRMPLDATAGRLTALAVGAVIAALPYMVLIGGVSNKDSVNRVFESPRRMLLGHAAAPRAVLFADWYEPARDGSQSAWAMKTILKETFKATHYLPFVLAVFGLGWSRRRLLADPGLAVVVALAAVNVAVLFALGQKSAAGNFPAYISERHTLLLALLACLFAAAAVEPLAQLLHGLPGVGGPSGPYLLLAAVAAAAVPSLARPLHENRTGHVHAGRFLASQSLGDRDAVIDPFCWAEWYAGRSLYAVPADPADPAVRWAVLDDKNDDHHSRLPRLADALNVRNDTANPPQLVYWWPEVPAAVAEKPAKYGGSQVRVYRQDVK